VIARELGSGGMGTVYEATHDDGRRVALKLVHLHVTAQPTSMHARDPPAA